MKLKTKLVSIFLLATLIPFILGMAYVVNAARNSIIEDGKNIATNYTSAVAERMSLYFEKWMVVCDVLSHFQFIKDKNWQELDPVFKSISKEYPEITDFFITNRDGTYWYGSTDGNPYKDYMVTEDASNPNSPFRHINGLTYQRVLVTNNEDNENKSVVTEVYISIAQRARMLSMASTIIENGIVQGVVGVSAETSALEIQCHEALSDIDQVFGKEARFIVTSQDENLLIDYLWDDDAQSYVNRTSQIRGLETTESISDDFYETVNFMLESGTEHTLFKNGEIQTFLTSVSVKNSPYKVYLMIPQSVIEVSATKITFVMAVVGLIMMILLIAATIIFGGRITKLITKTANSLKDVSVGSGDLTMRLKENSKDEIGTLGKHFNDFIDTLHTMISNIKTESIQLESTTGVLEKEVETISSDIENISKNISTLNEKTTEQNNSTLKTSSTIDEISGELKSLIGQINQQSSALIESSGAVNKMVDNINSISNNLNRATQKFNDLRIASIGGKDSIGAVLNLVTGVSEQSTKLLDTNKLINAIANQTNLLAMNAAIEAAHAGDAGRGFAVVASEIRSLAENSAKQSKTIADELKNIVATISQIVEATSKADISFDTVVQQINVSGQIVEEISADLRKQTSDNTVMKGALENIQNITEEVRDYSVDIGYSISTILDEMSHLTGMSAEVKQNTDGIATAIKTILASVENIKSNSEKNANTVEKLNTLTGKFKL